MSKHMDLLQGRRASLVAERDGILDNATAESFTPEVQNEVRAKNDAITELDVEIKNEKDREAREAAAGAHRVESNTSGVTVNEPNPIYRKGDTGGASFFRDLFFSGTTMPESHDARERLQRSQETRALSTSAGAGGQFAPPLWLIDEFVALARAGRVTADLVRHDVLPDRVSSINLPTIATGTSTAVQSTQNSALSQTDLTTSSVSSGISTIGGKQVVALQLLRQSGISFDQVVLADLAADYARQLDTQVLNGSGGSSQLQGIIGTSGVNAQTYTNATPAVVGSGQFYSQIVQAVNAINTNRFAEPTVIVMHPRRWAWVLNALDTANRPLVVPNGAAFNQLATDSGRVAQGGAGTLLGLPVYIDANVPTNLGAGTNQDPVIVMRADDLWLYETALEADSFDATYADQASILFRVLAFSAFIPNRYPKGIAVINGTGLVTPTF